MTFAGRAAFAATFFAAAALSPQSSLAADPQEVAEALAAALQAGTDNSVTFGEARADGADVVITDLTGRGAEDETGIVFSRTVVVAPQERSEGGFEAQQIEMTGGTLTGEASGTVENATTYGATILSAEEIAAQELTQGVLYERVEVTGVTFDLEDQPGEIAIARVEINADNVVDNVPQASSGMAEGIVVPATAFGEGPMTPQALGYARLEFELSWEGARDPDTNELTVDEFTLAMLEGGRLTLSGRVGNVPFGQLDNPMASPGAAGEITLHHVRLRYEDESLTPRILDAVARPQGMTGQQYAQQLSAALPFLLAVINNPGFQQQVAGAVGAFLQDPQSLTIEIAPEEPVSGEEIMGIVNTAPQTLPDRLNATITANGQ
jgi:hypothetical protein